MESSIAVFLLRQSACELLPTIAHMHFHSCLLRICNSLFPFKEFHHRREPVVCVVACSSGVSSNSRKTTDESVQFKVALDESFKCILAEGAIALSVTLSGGALFAS